MGSNMPKLSSDCDVNVERQNAYRRGYTHGMAAAITGMAHLLPAEAKDRINDWFVKELTAWRDSQDPSQLFPPGFPRTD